MISKLSVTDFTPAAKSEVTAENIIWACCKGLSDEIVSVTGYLINKNNYTYGYNDIIVSEDGISEIFVYSDDVNKVIKEFPNIKVAAFHTMKTAVKYLFVIRKADIRCLQINMKPTTVI